MTFETLNDYIDHTGMVLEERGYSNEEIDAYFLKHYGTKGMRWGQRKQNRAMNKASRSKDKAKLDKKIDKARGTLASGKAKADYKSAKAQYKLDKQTMGSREARKILNKTKYKNMELQQTAQLAKSGREKTLAILATAGLVAITAASVYKPR